MTDDRKLLEAAARAAGVYYWVDRDIIMTHGYDGPGSAKEWNPLESDADAFRLAVSLNLRVVFHPALNQALVREYHSNHKKWLENGEDHADPYAATRRAIVRAAAAMEQE